VDYYYKITPVISVCLCVSVSVCPRSHGRNF